MRARTELWHTKSQAVWVEGAHPTHSLPLQTSLRSLTQHSPQPGPKAVSLPPLSSVAQRPQNKRQGKGLPRGPTFQQGGPRLLHTAIYGRGKAEGVITMSSVMTPRPKNNLGIQCRPAPLSLPLPLGPLPPEGSVESERPAGAFGSLQRSQSSSWSGKDRYQGRGCSHLGRRPCLWQLTQNTLPGPRAQPWLLEQESDLVAV